MSENALKPSENFRKTAIKSVWSVVLFIVTYVSLIAVSILLTIICGYLGIKLIELYATYITLILGVGLISFGVLVFFFLVKFVFKSNRIDRSHLLEIRRTQEPALFTMIDDIVGVVQSDFPKKVYLSAESNAAVFYDSSFWSMFLPIRKNLQIGMGLINTTTNIELKAILAHEFGHFSQKSMKLGSYVYNVNQIIHDILYDNESYGQLTQKIASANSFLGIFVLGSEKVIGLMQQVLVRVYGILNANYSKLSHEMEFHADAVAALTVGSRPLIDSLLRIQLANQALDMVLSYYDRKINLSVKSNNLFPQQLFVMNFLAKHNKLPYRDGFPQVDLRYHNRFNKSRLRFDQVYSSHPETDARIIRLEELNAPTSKEQIGLALDLLASREEIAIELSTNIFANVNYLQTPVDQNIAEFEIDFINQVKQNSYPDLFNDYFDYRNPFINYTESDFANPVINLSLSVDELFGHENLDLIYELNALEADCITIDRISSGAINTKTFHYNGKKYYNGDCRSMIEYLNEEIQIKKEQLESSDLKIFEYFRYQANKQKLSKEFELLALWYKKVADRFAAQNILYSDLINSTSFMRTTTPPEMIKEKMVAVKNEEKKFKECVVAIQSDKDYSEVLTPEIRVRFDEYLKCNYKYFGADLYFDEELKVLFATLADFADIITTIHLKAKRALLEFEARLLLQI